MNKLINDQISNTHNVNSNYSINNETVNIINLTNNSLFNNNKNPITSAYEFIIKLNLALIKIMILKHYNIIMVLII
ncbi:hypothetical protein ONA24_07230 [Mycoplasmopsis cynos]|nr:hypothetical protein [Mycoplasmopsis cynos]WAM09709.1 hypothetical protein ONA24_07230 [Mycoplasmopsis cynos]